MKQRAITKATLASGAPRVLAEETPVALVYNGETLAVMMASPRDLHDFAVGFSLAEGVVSHPGQIEDLQIVAHADGLEVQMVLSGPASQALAERRRAMTGPVGCGLCGIDSLAQAMRPLPPLTGQPPQISPAALAAGMDALRAEQVLHDATHAAHAAGFLSPHDGLVSLREDVGRHNALDKLIGALARAGRDPASGALLITSRVSVDMVQKAVMARAGMLVAVSAPTALAVRTARAAGLMLIANARNADCDIFNAPNSPETGHVA